MTILRGASLLDESNYNTFISIATTREAWISANMPAIEQWLRENVNPEPQGTTTVSTSTLAIETTTDGSSTIILSGFVILGAILVKLM